MDNKFIFFDIKDDLVDAVKQEFTKGTTSYQNFSFVKTDVNSLLNNNKIDMIVSPANSLGFMTGGIDGVYSRIFPDIQTTVQASIRQCGIDVGVFHLLPVGSAITVATGSDKCPLLICAPTMETPKDIRHTENVYYAFLGILNAVKFYKNVTIAVPGLGTGVGMISAEVCAKEIKRAYDDFINNNLKDIKVLSHTPGSYVLANHACRQKKK